MFSVYLVKNMKLSKDWRSIILIYIHTKYEIMYRVCMIAEVVLLSQSFVFVFQSIIHWFIYFCCWTVVKNVEYTFKLFNCSCASVQNKHFYIKKTLNEEEYSHNLFSVTLCLWEVRIYLNLMLLMSHLGVNKEKDNTPAQHNIILSWCGHL